MTRREFAELLLQRLGLPVSQNNVEALIAFEKIEAGHTNGASYNPMNTCRDATGARSAGLAIPCIKAYSSWQEGLEATAKTLEQGTTSHVSPAFDMSGIFRALKESAPADVTLAAVAASPWGWSHGVGPVGLYQSLADVAFPGPSNLGLGMGLGLAFGAHGLWKPLVVIGGSAAAGLLLFSFLKRRGQR